MNRILKRKLKIYFLPIMLSKNRLGVLHIMVILDSGRYYDEIMSKVR